MAQNIWCKTGKRTYWTPIRTPDSPISGYQPSCIIYVPCYIVFEYLWEVYLEAGH